VGWCLHQFMVLRFNPNEQERHMRYVSSIEEITIEETQKGIAIKMLEDQVPLETIARYTGLSIEQLQELQSRQK
jgi:predicted HTH domain antitoxin